MFADEAQAGLSWRAAPYWPYRDRIHREFARNGLAGMRTNQTLLKGFAGGGMSHPALPRAGWKRFIWRCVEATPGVARVVAENRRLLHATHQRAINAEIRTARLALDRTILVSGPSPPEAARPRPRSSSRPRNPPQHRGPSAVQIASKPGYTPSASGNSSANEQLFVLKDLSHMQSPDAPTPNEKYGLVSDPNRPWLRAWDL